MQRRKILGAVAVLLLAAGFLLWPSRPRAMILRGRGALPDEPGPTQVALSTARLRSIRIEPANASVAQGATTKFSAFASYSDNEVRDVTSEVRWSSSTPAATIVKDSPGSVSGAAIGVSTVRAAIGDIVGAADLAVTASSLVAIAIAPPAPVLAVGENIVLAATGSYSDGTTRDITGEAAWESSTQDVVVSGAQKGAAFGANPGSSIVVVKKDGVESAVLVRVDPAAMAEIQVVPHDATATVGETLSFNATSVNSDGSLQDITSLVVWQSSNPSVLKMGGTSDERGAGTAVARGKVTVTAAFAEIRGSTTLSIR